MQPKGRRYLILLLISIVVRIFFFFFRFEGTSLEPVATSHMLYDILFFSVMISLLELIRERKWLIGLTWIALLACITYGILQWINDTYSFLPAHLYTASIIVMGFFFLSYYICIFFARKSPVRVFFRCMPALTVVPYFYVLFAMAFHLPSPAGVAIVSILLNLLLAVAVWRTPQLRQAEYADFLT